MRQIVLDTETTGLEPKQGHRIIEIACVEMINRCRTDKYFHSYINPQREIDDGAFDVHGISNGFLDDKPVFSDIAQEFIDFIKDSELIIHNAPFDIAFINAELKQLGKKWGKTEDYCKVADTLIYARKKHPGQKNSLDALCVRYKLNNYQRDKHGALLDAQILLDVYLAMTGGQNDLKFEQTEQESAEQNSIKLIDLDGCSLTTIEPSHEELQQHESFIQKIKNQNNGKCIWIDKNYN